jgi:LysM repeat protein
MGNFERLSVLVIVVIIVLIVVIALVQLTESNDTTLPSMTDESTKLVSQNDPGMGGGVVISQPITTPPLKLTVKDLVGDPPPAPPPAPVVEPPKPEPAKVEEARVHVVQPGETIARIAKIYYPNAVTKGTDLILKANAVDPTRMRVGTKLTIPPLEGMAAVLTPASGSATPPRLAGTTSTSIAAGGTYTTKKGDTLGAISRRAYGQSDRWQDIWLANYDAIGDDVDHPPAGIRLKIPR